MRRAFVPNLVSGDLTLDPSASHHLRTVLRAALGDAVELFDAAGRSAVATIRSLDADGVRVMVGEVRTAPPVAAVSVASAVPKLDRADWLVEKLCELGVARWTPLRTARSVVHPEGAAKFDRWRRIAVEAAKQSRRAGVMEIDRLTAVEALAFEGVTAIVLSTRGDAGPLATVERSGGPALLLVGPEGGWTDDELDALAARGARFASLTTTVLRIETAAIVAAGFVLARQ